MVDQALDRSADGLLDLTDLVVSRISDIEVGAVRRDAAAPEKAGGGARAVGAPCCGGAGKGCYHAGGDL